MPAGPCKIDREMFASGFPLKPMRSVGICGREMRGGGKSQASCQWFVLIPNSFGRGSQSIGSKPSCVSKSVPPPSLRRSVKCGAGASSLCQCRVFSPQSVGGKRSCASESVSPPTLRESVQRGANARSLCVSAKSARAQSAGGQKSCASGSVPPSTQNVATMSSHWMSVLNLYARSLWWVSNPVLLILSLRPR